MAEEEFGWVCIHFSSNDHLTSYSLLCVNMVDQVLVYYQTGGLLDNVCSPG
jgi:hypothetical protein